MGLIALASGLGTLWILFYALLGLVFVDILEDHAISLVVQAVAIVAPFFAAATTTISALAAFGARRWAAWTGCAMFLSMILVGLLGMAAFVMATAIL